MTGKIQNAIATKDSTTAIKEKSKQSVNQLMNAMLDGENLRSRFNDLLGQRAPQFISSIVSLVNADENMQKAFYEFPMSIIQSALKAASFDLPIDQNLGYAYIVPFKNKGVMTGTFILGWKGMHQLAIRTGAYKTINVIDVREGELKSYNRLTEEIKIDFIEDENEREKRKIIGYVGYYRLVNGAEKTIYRTVAQIDAHEKKFRKGDYMGKGWREDWDSMARKTVYRELIGKWGVMSIEYQNAKDGASTADMIKSEFIDTEHTEPPIATTVEYTEIDNTTGEVIENVEQ